MGTSVYWATRSNISARYFFRELLICAAVQYATTQATTPKCMNLVALQMELESLPRRLSVVR
jgi:hypothetical protein